ncbi:unnamed protein product [Arctia plantaginis]|nr:unnamed protein product [Arctia plantaginis]
MAQSVARTAAALSEWPGEARRAVKERGAHGGGAERVAGRGEAGGEGYGTHVWGGAMAQSVARTAAALSEWPGEARRAVKERGAHGGGAERVAGRGEAGGEGYGTHVWGGAMAQSVARTAAALSEWPGEARRAVKERGAHGGGAERVAGRGEAGGEGYGTHVWGGAMAQSVARTAAALSEWPGEARRAVKGTGLTCGAARWRRAWRARRRR